VVDMPQRVEVTPYRRRQEVSKELPLQDLNQRR